MHLETHKQINFYNILIQIQRGRKQVGLTEYISITRSITRWSAQVSYSVSVKSLIVISIKFFVISVVL